MKIKSVSSLTCFVKNLDATRAFYEVLGFDFKKIESTHIAGYINWFSIEFIAIDSMQSEEFKEEAEATPKGSGIYINLSVDDVDAVYRECIEHGLKPSSEPRDWPWKSREFAIRDPDGYKLVFFKKR